MRRVLVWLPNSEDRVAPELKAVVNCHSIAELRIASAQGDIHGFVIDPVEAGIWASLDDTRFVYKAPVVLRTSLTPMATRQMVRMTSSLPLGRVSFRTIHDLNEDVRELLAGSLLPSPELRVVASCSLLPTSVQQPVVAAAILGRRRAYLRDLALVCAVSPRTVEWRLQRSGLVGANSLLGWAVALHTVWRLDVLNWTMKRCAATAGFYDADTLADYVSRHIGQRPLQACKAGGFEALLRRWERLIECMGMHRSTDLRATDIHERLEPFA